MSNLKKTQNNIEKLIDFWYNKIQEGKKTPRKIWREYE